MDERIGNQLPNSQVRIHGHFLAEGLADLFIGGQQGFKVINQVFKADGVPFVAIQFTDGLDPAIAAIQH